LTSKDTTLLLGLDGLAVDRVELDACDVPVVHLSTSFVDAACCPTCGVRSSATKQWVSTHPRDLSVAGRAVTLVWRKRRWYCHNRDCPAASFTESTPAVAPRSRLTTRLRAAAGAAVGDAGRTVIQAGRDLGLCWPTVMAATTAHAAAVLPDQVEPVTVLGIDETNRGRPRFTLDQATQKWTLVAQRYHVGFVDISGGQGLLGQVEGRNAKAVIDWLDQRGETWRRQVRHVAIDMSSVFLSAARDQLPDATVVVDHFHVVQLANTALTEVRCRITTQTRSRRGRKGDGEYDVRNHLTRNMEDLSPHRFARMWNTLADLGNPGYEILGAYIAKEQLRELLALARTGANRHTISQRLYQFYAWCADADIPEITRLATTIDQWWPHIEAFIHSGITNATSEGVNRVVKLVARNAFGFTNTTNQRLRTRLVTTRRARGHLGTPRSHPSPVKFEEPVSQSCKIA
jgi:transposase